MGQWAKEWQVEFNLDKYEVLHFSKANQGRTCIFNGKILVSFAKERELGMQFPSSLKAESQVDRVVKKASGTLALIGQCMGIGVVVECLKDVKKVLSTRCHDKIFKLQESEMSDPELDYTLMRVCKQMIKRYCADADSKNVLQCLKQNKNAELMDPKCKQMITKRQITQNTDYRLNPVLRKACKADIPKFCQSVLNNVKDGKELEGQVVSCLKLKYADQ
eukprot:g44521.t1